jgi:hypothetical protein
MERKELRSYILSFVLGDGCLHYTSNKVSGSLTINHGVKQADYQSWKAAIISQFVGRDIKVRSGHKGKSVQISVAFKRFKAWRKWLYPNGKKDITRILKHLYNPTFAATVWLMDDGYVESSFSKLASGDNHLYGAAFRIFTCAVPEENQQIIIDWFTENLEVTPWVRFQTRKGVKYPFLKFSVKDSLKLWEQIREFVLGFKSMQYKFRHME